MKKFYFFLFAFFVGISGKLSAQLNYSFAASSGTYTAITGTTLTITDAAPVNIGDPLDEGFASAIPIGFSFNYNGTNYTTINACTNGFASLGAAITVDENENYYTNNLSTGPSTLVSTRPILAPLWDDHALGSATDLKYEVTGTSPNRVFTLQWSNVYWRYTAAAASISFQIKLYEGTNVVQFVYNQEAGAVGSTPTASIGITAATTGSGSFLSLSGSGAAPTASNSTETTSIATRPATGQIYAFTPLSGCSGTPTAGTASSSVATICNNQAFNLILTGATSATGITYKWQRSTVGAGSWTDVAGATTATATISQTGAFDYRCVVKCTNGNAEVNSNIITVTVSTTNCPPACATNTTPANAATGVSYLPNIPLVWAASTGATSYDLYFGTTNPPTSNLGNTTATTINITGGAANTTYYWYVVPKNANGNLATCGSSAVTSFTTGAAPAAPANNECAGAVTISAYTGVTAGTGVGATASASIPTSSCAGTPDDDVWYKFTASYSGTAIITVVGGTGYDAVVQGFSGTCGALVSLGCADVTFSAGTEVLTLTGLTAGETYYVRVYDWFSAAFASFTISAAGSALPVSQLSFKGDRQGTSNLLSWTTSTEVNNAGFELQRSADGVNFSALTFVASKATNGNSSNSLTYSFADTKSLATGLYYRLKQLDKDGKSTLSAVVFIKGSKVNSLQLASIYPNPVVDKLNVLVASPKADMVTFMISDLAGKVILSQVVSLSNGDNTVQLNVANLAKGTYTIKAICADGCETAISKFMKQ